MYGWVFGRIHIPLPDVTLILLATASILIDRALPRQGIRDRLCCQVWLWLAASLSQLQGQQYGESHDSHAIAQQQQQLTAHDNYHFNHPSRLVQTWVHAILFGNIIPIVVVAMRPRNKSRDGYCRNPTTSHGTNSLFSRTNNNNNNNIMTQPASAFSSNKSTKTTTLAYEQLSTLLAPSAWVALLAATLMIQWTPPSSDSTTTTLQATTTASTMQPNNDETVVASLWVFGISFMVFWMMQWQERRKRRLEQEWQGMPVSTTTATQDPFSYVTAAAPITTYNNNNNNNNNHHTTIQPSSTLFRPDDEQVWYTWSPSQVLQWMSWILKQQQQQQQQGTTIHKDDTNETDDDDDDDDPDEDSPQELLVSRLQPHYISGRVLDTLTLQELRSLDVPYGPACCLALEIQRLRHTHPKPTKNSTTQMTPPPLSFAWDPTGRGTPSFSTSATPAADWLTLHDQKYNNNTSTTSSKTNNGTHPRPLTKGDGRGTRITSTTGDLNHQRDVFSTSDNSAVLDDDVVHERMQSIMKERYGLELPKLKSSDLVAAVLYGHKDNNINNPNDDAINDIIDTSTTAVPPISDTTTPMISHVDTQPLQQESSSPTEQGGVGIPVPEGIWNSMPPHIQEVAKRNPHVVQKLLAYQQLQLQQQQQQQQRRQPQAQGAGRYTTDDTFMATIHESDCARMSSNRKSIPLGGRGGTGGRGVDRMTSNNNSGYYHSYHGEDNPTEPLTRRRWEDPSYTQSDYTMPNSSNIDDERTTLLQHRKKKTSS
jgi:hypothetical protein